VAFREVGVHEIKEVLRLWFRGEGLRSIARLSRVDRKTVRRYVEAARECGLSRAGDDGQLGDELLSRVAERIRPHRSGGHGDSWALLAAHEARLEELLDQGLTVVRAGELLAREGVVVPQRTLHRYALEVLRHGRASRAATVRVADCEPGATRGRGQVGRVTDPRRPACRHGRVRDAGSGLPAAARRRVRPGHRRYAAALLDHPLPWKKMRQVYARIPRGLVQAEGVQ